MPMFSFSKSSFESRLLNVLQDGFMRAAKRNKILAKWAGGRLGYTRDALDKYVRSVIFSHLVSRNDERIIATILSDFEKEGIHITEETIRRKIQSIETRIKHRAKSKDVD